MTPAGRLIAFAFFTVVLAGVSYWITRESLRTRESPQDIGLRWLKEEYQIGDAAFQSILSLHQEYFTQCGQMCRQIDEANRPLLWRTRQRHRAPGDLSAQVSKAQTICSDCEKAAINHLEQVAKLMPPGQGPRFLADILPAVQEQRREHDRRTSSSLRK